MPTAAFRVKPTDQPVSIVTGGDGFIGRALSRRLLRDGHHVVVVDNHSTSAPIVEDDGVERHVENIEEIDLSCLPDPDYVFHLASVAYPQQFSRTRRELFQTNVVATERLLEWVASRSSRFVFASTSEVYGLAESAFVEQRGIREDDRCSASGLTERSIYPTTKRMGEELVVSARLDGVEAFCVRPFNVYGPGMDRLAGADARVIPRFLEAVRSGRRLPVCGDGQQVRSFLWIEDAVNAILGLAKSVQLPPPAINVGRDEPISVIALAELVCELCLVPLRVDQLPPRDGEPVWRRPNIDALQEWTGMIPQVSLRAGLARMLEVSLHNESPAGSDRSVQL